MSVADRLDAESELPPKCAIFFHDLLQFAEVIVLVHAEIVECRYDFAGLFNKAIDDHMMFVSRDNFDGLFFAFRP